MCISADARPNLAAKSEDSCLLVCETVQSRIPIAVASRTTVWRGEAALAADVRFVDGARRAGHNVVVTLAPGDKIELA